MRQLLRVDVDGSRIPSRTFPSLCTRVSVNLPLLLLIGDVNVVKRNENKWLWTEVPQRRR